MLYRIKTIDGVKTKVPLAGSTPAGLPVGSILSTYKKIQPYNYLYCDGSTFDETQYPELYLYLGTNVLPDYRECVQVGAEKNTTDIFDSTETDPSTGLPGTQSHDVFSQGEFKDDQLQGHTHGNGQKNNPNFGWTVDSGIAGYISAGMDQLKTDGINGTPRTGTTTRTKEKAVYYYIKAVDGVDIADEDTFLNTVVNTIQDAQSYSTTEEKTGGKWIDGKDIYRKCIPITLSTESGDWFNITGVNPPSNVDQHIKVWGIGNTTNGFTQIMPGTYGLEFSAYYHLYRSYTRTGGNGWLIIEYTKNE